MDISKFCEVIHYPIGANTTKELAELLRLNLVSNYTRGRMTQPYIFESYLEEDGCVVLYRGVRYLLDYRTNEIYVVRIVHSVPFGDYMRKLKTHVDDILKNQMDDYLLGNKNQFEGGPDEEYAKKAGVEYDYVFQTYNRYKMVWYKKEEKEND